MRNRRIKIRTLRITNVIIRNRKKNSKIINNLAIFFSISTNYICDPEGPDFDSPISHAIFFKDVVSPLVFEGIFLDKFDSYMLGDNDLLSFQHRSLDTDVHVIACSLMSTRFLINALDVLHSFTILSSGLKIDAIVGRVNDMTLFFLREGLFYGQCSDFVEQAIIVCLLF